MNLRLPARTLDCTRRPLVMGIVNINADSFSGDGTLDPEAALAKAGELVAAGADLIDVGAESARTNRAAIPEAEEIRRLMPFLEEWPRRLVDWKVRDEAQLWPPVLSINTWRSEVAEAALAGGGELLNDMSALAEATNARVAAAHGAALLIMHSVGQPKVAHTHVQYRDVMQELERFFEERIALAEKAGLHREQLLLDPGIDFAKQKADNLRIFRELSRLTQFGRPILMPVSRKTVIGEVLGIAKAAERDAGTVACTLAGLAGGATIFRVHHVAATYETIRLWEALGVT